MKLTFRNVHDDTFHIDAAPWNTVAQLKEHLSDRLGCPVPAQKILLRGNLLDDHHKVESYTLEPDEYFTIEIYKGDPSSHGPSTPAAEDPAPAYSPSTSPTSPTQNASAEGSGTNSGTSTSTSTSTTTPARKSKRAFVRKLAREQLDKALEKQSVVKGLKIAEVVLPDLFVDFAKAGADYLNKDVKKAEGSGSGSGSGKGDKSPGSPDPNAPPSYASLNLPNTPDTSTSKELVLGSSSSSHSPDSLDLVPPSSSSRGLASTSTSIPIGSSGLIGVSHLTIPEFCEHVRLMPDLRTAEIVELYRREVPTGVRHEYVMLKVVVPVQGQGQEQGETIVRWVRIDRAAKDYKRPSLGNLSLASIVSTFVADDSVRIGTDHNHKLMAGDSVIKAKIHFKQPAGHRPQLVALGNLLVILEQESYKYKLLSENCYFFTSVIQDVLTSNFNGDLVEGKLGHLALGPEVRERVRMKFGEVKGAAQLVSSTSAW